MAANAWQRGSWAFDFLFSETKDPAAPETTSPESTEMTQEQLLDSFHLMATSSEDLPILWNAINNYESMKALEATDIKKWKVSPGAGGLFRLDLLGGAGPVLSPG